MTLATSCPQCGTTFRVRSEQLKVRGGMVRCGRCKHVFRALDALRALEAEAPPVATDPAANAPTAVSAHATPEPAMPSPGADDVAAPGAPADAPPPSEGEFELSVPNFDDPVVVAAAGRLHELDRSPPGDVPDPFARPLAPQARALDDDFHSSISLSPLPAPDASAPDAIAAIADDPLSVDAVGRLDADKRLPSDDALDRAPHPATGGSPDSGPDRARAGVPSASTASTASMASTASARDAHAPAPRGGDVLFASAGAPRRSRATILAGTALVLLLALAAALQATLLARDTLAARYPGLAPVVSSLSAAFGLRVGLPRRLSQLTIEGFDLQAVPGSAQLAMTAVLRNTGALPLQWPAMEITLTDTTGEVVVRKALLPTDYLRGTPARLDAGIAAGTEVPLRLALQGPAGVPTGYTVNLFYP